MALRLPIQYEQLVALVEQLSEDLIQRLLAFRAQHIIEEKLKLLEAATLIPGKTWLFALATPTLHGQVLHFGSDTSIDTQ